MNKKRILKSKIKQIERQLANLRWIPIKVFLGEWDKEDKRYLDYLDKRLELRNKHQELLDEFNGLD